MSFTVSFTQPLTRPRVAKRVFSRNSKSAAVRASGATDDGKTGWVFAGKLPMLPPAGPVLALPGSTETGAPKFMNAKEAFNFSLGAALGRPAPIPEPTEEVTLPISASPRRTMRIRFTCNKCQHRSARCINPHAYATGTVFVQCEGCLVHHKLIDNLNLFHELQGPVFTGTGAAQDGESIPGAPRVGGVDVLGSDDAMWL